MNAVLILALLGTSPSEPSKNVRLAMALARIEAATADAKAILAEPEAKSSGRLPDWMDTTPKAAPVQAFRTETRCGPNGCYQVEVPVDSAVQSVSYSAPVATSYYSSVGFNDAAESGGGFRSKHKAKKAAKFGFKANKFSMKCQRCGG